MYLFTFGVKICKTTILTKNDKTSSMNNSLWVSSYKTLGCTVTPLFEILDLLASKVIWRQHNVGSSRSYASNHKRNFL